MELRDYLHAMAHGWWLVVGALVIAVGSAGLINVSTPPRYATSITFFITTPVEDGMGMVSAYQGSMFSQHRVKSYVDLLTGDRLARQIATRENVGLDPAAVQARITGNAVAETVLLHATVTDGQPSRSLNVAHSVARQFKIMVEELETPNGQRTSPVRVEVIAGPRLQAEPVSPRPLRNLMLGALLGLLLGMALAVLREILDTSVKTAEMLKVAAGAPVLSVIPYDAKAGDAPVIRQGNHSFTRAEAIRQLRTNLRFVDVDEPVTSVVITSAVPNEGKSSTAVNLAIMLADSGRRALLVDADLRRPRIAGYLGLEGAVGLTDVLAGQVDLQDVIQQWGTGLWVLPSGAVPPNPSEMLGSRQMKDLLRSLRHEFDTIIVDAPPLLPVTDAAVVASRVDGAILVTRCGKTTRGQVQAAAEALHSVEARLFGGVLNMVPTRVIGGYGYGYGYREYGPREGTRPAGGQGSVPAAVATPDTGQARGSRQPARPAGSNGRHQDDAVPSGPAR